MMRPSSPLRLLAPSLLLAGLGLAATPAQAQDPNAPTAPPLSGASGATGGSPGMPSILSAGLLLMPMPVGSFSTEAMGRTDSQDAKVAFGVAPWFEGKVHDYVSLGAVAQILFNVQGKNSMGDAAKEVDLVLRAVGYYPLNDRLKVYGFLAPGYSVIVLPNKQNGEDNPSGFLLEFGGGVAFDLSGPLFLSGQLGYQIGFQRTKFTVLGQTETVKISSNYLHIGVGLGYRI